MFKIIYSFLFALYSSLKFCRFCRGKKSKSKFWINIDIPNYESINMGENVFWGQFTSVVVRDENSRSNNSKLSVGSNTYIGEYNNIRAAGGAVTIGSNCLISQHVSIIASNHCYKKNELILSQPWSVENNFVVIEDDVWVGCNCVILPGVCIARGTIIAAGSVVTKSTEPYSIVAGNPAKLIKYRE